MQYSQRLPIFLSICLLLAIHIASCQSNKNVPDVVKSAFKTKFPKESDPDWRTDKNNNFESHFKKDGEHYRADFDPEGNWIETERSIKKGELPQPVQKRIKADFKDYQIVEIEEVRHYSKGLFYDVELKRDGEKMDKEFDAAGNTIN